MEQHDINYEAELLRQEINANKHTVKSFLWFLLAMTVIWLLTMIDFFLVPKSSVCICYALALTSFIPTFLIYRKKDLTKWWHKYFFMTVVCIVCTEIATILSFHAVLIYVMPLLFAIQYRQRKVLWFTFGVNSIGVLVSMIVGFYYGLCDLNMLLQSQYSISHYLDLIINQSQFIPFNNDYIFIITAFGVFPRCLILFIFTIIIQYAITSSNDDAYRIAKLTIQKEFDANTKVYNKNKLEEMKEEYYPKISDVGVLFLDINNLKVINDAYGHDVGDYAISCLAGATKKYVSDSCRVYRVGGDEFVMIFDTPKAGELEKIYHEIQVSISKLRINGVIKVSSAGGISYGAGDNIENVIKDADTKMYLEKKLQKESRTKNI